MNERPHAIPAVAAAILLVVALGDHPYGYFTFLRWSVSVAAIVVAWVAWSSRTQPATWLFVGIAILFNPIAPVYMSRDNWSAIDIVAAVCFLASLALRRNDPARADARYYEAEYNRLLHEAVETTDPEHFMRLDAEMRRVKRRTKFTFGSVVGLILVGGFLTLFVADIVLQSVEHPVKLPGIGWIGDPDPPPDPGDCDPQTSVC
jgi:hypothetical protein